MVPVVSVYDKSDVERNVGFSNSGLEMLKNELQSTRRELARAGELDYSFE